MAVAVAASTRAAEADGVAVIVQFFDPPRVVAGRAAAAEDSIARFRRDLGAVHGRIAASSAAPAPEIAHEYRNLVTGVALTVPRPMLAEIQRLPYVKSVVRDGPVRFFAMPVPRGAAAADTRYSADVTTLGADKLWALGSRGKGVVVAVIDSGVDYTLPSLGGCLGPGCRVIGGYDFADDDPDPMDVPIQHGTAVANIIAGNAENYTGVAPEATLLAYRIWSDAGVLAAMERAVDPNGDGDFSDRADVMNLSLGTGGWNGEPAVGSPSDLWSTAANNAVAAGVVVVAATGNEGKGHEISCPAMASSAIAVGLLDRGGASVAGLTSRGPTPRDMTIKPELTAPGDGAWSIHRGGEVFEFGGTSSASPHVAGAAALLLALHPDWTPSRVKQALMNTARTLANDDVLSQGAGLAAVDRAAAASVAVDPPALSLGLYPLAQQTWTQSRTLRVVNHGSAAAAFDVTASGVDGATVSVSPSTISVPAGGAADVTVTMEISAAATPAPLTFGVGGFIEFTGTSGHTSPRVPWAAVKAARVNVVSDRPAWTVLWRDAGGTLHEPWFLDAYRTELLVPPGGAYDLLAWGGDQTGSARLVYRPAQRIDGDRTITLSAATAHTVTLDGRDELGRPPAERTVLAGRLLLPSGTEPPFLLLPPVSARTIAADALPADLTLLLTETWYDPDEAKVYVVSHQPVNGVYGDLTLHGGGAALRQVTTRTYSLPDPSRTLSLTVSSLLGDMPASGWDLSLARFTRAFGTSEVADATVLMSADTHPRFRTVVEIHSSSARRRTLAAPPLHVVDGRITTGEGSPVQASGDHLVFGRGVAYPQVRFNVQPAVSRLHVQPLSAGAAGEHRLTDVITPARFDVSLATPGLQRFELVTSGSLTPRIPRQSKAIFTLDTARADFVPPILTAVRLVDGDGRMTAGLAAGGRGSLLLAAADYTYSFTAAAYQPFRAEATTLSYRPRGATAWSPLALTQVLEDAGTEERLGQGVLYRADLSPITGTAGAVDLKIEIVDVAGNTAAYELESAFLIGPESSPRRRSVRP